MRERDRCQSNLRVIPKPRAFTSGARDLRWLVLRSAVNKNIVPINLEVGRDSNLLCAPRQLAREIGGHSAWAAGGETHVVDLAHPLAACVFFISNQRLHVRRDRLRTRL